METYESLKEKYDILLEKYENLKKAYEQLENVNAMITEAPVARHTRTPEENRMEHKSPLINGYHDYMSTENDFNIFG